MRPANGALYLIGAWLALAALAVFEPDLTVLWQFAGIGLAGILLVDAANLYFRHELAVERTVNGSIAVGKPATVNLKVHNQSNRHWYKTSVFDHAPNDWETSDNPLQTGIPAQGWVNHEYSVTPPERGDFNFSCSEVLIWSPWRCWIKKAVVQNESKVRVYPDFSLISQFSLLAVDNRLSQMGILKRQRRGEGLDFQQLRDYRQGDSLRRVDWKASARHRKLISKDYQDERDQQLLFLLDNSRRMLTRDENTNEQFDLEFSSSIERRQSHFDHALNAVLLLTYVAQRQGDAVGLRCFGGSQRGFKPIKGSHAVSTMLNTVYDLQPTLQTADYDEMARNVLSTQTRRALVVVLTNLRDESASDLLPALKRLQHRHLVLVANLRERDLDNVRDRDITSFTEALETASVDNYLALRNKVQDTVKAHGGWVIDVTPDNLLTAIVNSYLEIKASGKL